VIADLGVNHVERFVLRAGHTVEPIRKDYGLDLLATTFSAEGVLENGHFWLQVKATDKLRWRPDRQAILLRQEQAHLLHWLNEAFPIFLVVFDAQAEKANWLYVQRDLGSGRVFSLPRTGGTVTIQIPAGNVLDDGAIRQFGQWKAKYQAGEGR